MAVTRTGETCLAVPGRFIAVVGPSGVGKDSVISALAARDPRFLPVRRHITRPAEAGGEPHVPVSEAAFDAAEAAGGYALSWQAHGLRYGIPVSVDKDMEAGRWVLANLSRRALGAASARFPRLTVLWLAAPEEVLARRLAGRGREQAEAIAARLARAPSEMPEGLDVLTIDNSRPLEETVATVLARLQPDRAKR